MVTTKTYKEANSHKHDGFARLICPGCGEELVVNTTNMRDEIELYNPVEVTRAQVLENGKLVERDIPPYLTSSDYTKDMVTIKCCNCGKSFKMNPQKIYQHRCNMFGEDNIEFKLNDTETKVAREFMKEHSHQEEFDSERKMGFSTLGMQFTYMITPGGLGPVVTVRCNKCGETKDVTDVKNW